MHFSWDRKKDESNQEKHGVSFETAKLVFDDPYHLSTLDRYVDDEERWQTLGKVGDVVILLVAHTLEEEGNEIHIHIISARKATPRERNRYENDTV